MNRGNRHPIVEFYQHIAEGKTPGPSSYREYGLTSDAALSRIARDMREIHEVFGTGNRKDAADLARGRAHGLIDLLGNTWLPPEPESPRNLAAKIARH